MLPLLPLKIGVKRSAWRPTGEIELDSAFKQIKPEVLRRDGRCRFCGLAFPKYLEIHHIDDDHSNQSPENLLTTCNWCHLVHHIGFLGVNHMAFLAMHPEWPRKDLPSQAELNHLVRAAVCAPSTMGDEQRRAAEALLLCGDVAQAYLGTQDCAEFAEYLESLTDAEYAKRDKILDGVRVVYAFLRPDDLTDHAAKAAWDLEQARRDYWRGEMLRNLGDWSRYV